MNTNQNMTATVLKLMDQNGLTRAQMSEIIGISKSSLSRRLNNKTDWRTFELFRFVNKFGLSAEMVVNGSYLANS